MHCILNRCYAPANMTEGAKLSDSGRYIVPEDGSWDLYKAYCDSLPLVSEPEVFGMHDNANITKNQNETTNLFTSILVTQSSGGGGGGGGASREDTMDIVAADVLGKLMDEFDMEQVLIRYPVKWAESMNTVLSNELVRFNKLIRKIQDARARCARPSRGSSSCRPSSKRWATRSSSVASQPCGRATVPHA